MTHFRLNAPCRGCGTLWWVPEGEPDPVSCIVCNPGDVEVVPPSGFTLTTIGTNMATKTEAVATRIMGRVKPNAALDPASLTLIIGAITQLLSCLFGNRNPTAPAPALDPDETPEVIGGASDSNTEKAQKLKDLIDDNRARNRREQNQFGGFQPWLVNRSAATIKRQNRNTGERLTRAEVRQAAIEMLDECDQMPLQELANVIDENDGP